ncbi:hypothetical protein M9H77_23603 [Catharanthus roseus]|uniref:Uncharacterized protein n=1 Tax=Catharanthus roseus TaxID=4058 RepID=A0ACC0AVH3_CATRO|nr:hypothetical protein M9H77_23603 [Catharanthus roseus]
MGANIPAQILPASIDHVPFPTSLMTLSCGVFCFTRERSPEKKVFLFPSRVILRYVYRRGNQNSSCSAGIAWSKSVAGARLKIFPTPWHDTFRSSIPPAHLDAAPFSLSSTAISFLPAIHTLRSSYLCLTSVAGTIGRSKLWQDQSKGKQPSSKKNCATPPDPYRVKKLPSDP